MGWLTVSLFLGLFMWTLRSIMHLDCISFNLARSAMNEINIAWIRMWSETEGLIICAYWGPISICNSIGAEVMAMIIGFEEFQKLKAFRSIAEGDFSAVHRHTPFFLSLTFHSVFSCSIFFWNLSSTTHYCNPFPLYPLLSLSSFNRQCKCKNAQLKLI